MQGVTATTTAPSLGLLIRRPAAWKRHQLLASGGAPSRQQGCIWKLEAVSGKAEPVVAVPVRPQKKDEPRDLPGMIHSIRTTLKSISDGEINVSAYDTAWVALVKNQEGGYCSPQFPLSIDWIAKNQMPDGSWGDKSFFSIYDRVINTLACIVALKSWNVHDDKCRKGQSFICRNLWRLNEDDEDCMLCGFEITLPTLLEKAKDLGLDLPYDEPALQMIYAKREMKLAKIPKQLLHDVPTTLLLSIEGMPNLDWKKLFKFQGPDGSFMSSPAPTAYALMETGDRKCLEFLTCVTEKYNGGVPFTYPLDIFERLWAVDRLERLGISRYFTSEIEECLAYCFRHWTQEGLPATRDSIVNDIDDTAMGFRLLRLHGYRVDPSVFKHFEKDGEFVCYPMQSNQSITATYNLYRASQVAFPGEEMLEKANIFCRAFLGERRASGRLHDKWVIAKDLPGEVGYSLDFPWKASLPRVQTRMYLEQYGGGDDVWIGKVLYRMPVFSNDVYLDAAKQDFSNFQMTSRLEWHALRKWYDSNNLQAYGVAPESALRAYFLAAASIFEPDRAAERLAWARTAMLAEAISGYLQSSAGSDAKRERLIAKLEKHSSNGLVTREEEDPTEKAVLCELRELIDLASSDDASRGLLREAWGQWLRSWNHESFQGDTALLLVRAIEIASGRYSLCEQNGNRQEYSQLEQLTHSICCKLTSRVPAQNGENTEGADGLHQQVDLEMQRLTECVLQSCNSISRMTRETFLHVAKSYYYVAHCSPERVDSHIFMVIFKDVV